MWNALRTFSPRRCSKNAQLTSIYYRMARIQTILNFLAHAVNYDTGRVSIFFQFWFCLVDDLFLFFNSFVYGYPSDGSQTLLIYFHVVVQVKHDIMKINARYEPYWFWHTAWKGNWTANGWARKARRKLQYDIQDSDCSEEATAVFFKLTINDDISV